MLKMFNLGLNSIGRGPEVSLNRCSFDEDVVLNVKLTDPKERLLCRFERGIGDASTPREVLGFVFPVRDTKNEK